ncbi:MAG: hypothetical protein JSW08_00795 [archaeon]|nr:MAG: hypothetical protein JSW08_00795 [archaeon]
MKNKKFMKNKKAFFFTLTVLFLITLLLLVSFSYRREYTKESIRTRVLTTNSFVESVEKDAERAIYISGYRTVLGLLDYISSAEDYIPLSVDYDVVFKDAFINGELIIEGYDGSRFLEGMTLADWQGSIIDRASKQGINLEFRDLDIDDIGVSIGQSTPWAIDMNVTLHYVIEDDELNAVWDRYAVVEGKIPLYNLEDPFYTREFGRDVVSLIKRTPYTSFVNNSTGTCNGTNLSMHLERTWADGAQEPDYTSSFYAYSPNAPNYLSRLKGQFDAQDTESGIESIIHGVKVGRTLMPGKSLVDHSYFSSEDSEVKIVDATNKVPSWLEMTFVEANETYHIPPASGACLQFI